MAGSLVTWAAVQWEVRLRKSRQWPSGGRAWFPGSRAGQAGLQRGGVSAAHAARRGFSGGAVPWPRGSPDARFGRLPGRRGCPGRRSSPRGPAAPGCRTCRWAGGRWEIGPPGAAADHGAETWGTGCLRGGVLLRQPAGEIPALLLQHALLGENRGGQGAPGLTGIPGAPRGLPEAGRLGLGCPVPWSVPSGAS